MECKEKSCGRLESHKRSREVIVNKLSCSQREGIQERSEAILEMQKRESDIEIYERLILTIQDYFCGKDIQYMFLHGGCYFLAMTLHKYIPDSVVVFNRKMQHCASLFSNGVYDIRGRIQSKDFFVATTEDMKYMQKHFVPSFDEEALAKHLKKMMNENKGKDDIVCGTKKVIRKRSVLI